MVLIFLFCLELDATHFMTVSSFHPGTIRILEKGFASAARFVVLVRNSFSETDQFSVQVSPLFDNGGGPLPAGYENQKISYPHRTISESKVEGVAKAQGFRLVARLDEYSGAIGESYGKQSIYERG